MKEGLSPAATVELLGNRLQLEPLSGIASAADSHLAQGPALPKVTYMQGLIKAGA